MPTQQTKTIGIPACIMMKSVWTYYTLYCVYMITSRRTRAAAAETDGVGEQQLKWMQSGAVWSDHARLVLARDTTAQGASE